MSKVKFFALGGLQEIGKNLYVVDVDDKLFIFDCGLKYPTSQLYGVDLIVNDISYLEKNESIHLNNKKKEALYDAYIIYLKMDRELLYDRINKRVELMVKNGLVEEVKSLYDDGIYPHAIGYSELIPYFNGEETLDSAIEEIKKNTRHLAKRQETWFKNQMDCHFYDVDINNINNTIDLIISDIDRWLK